MPRLQRQRGRQKSSRLNGKTITLHVHHAFLYISLPLLHDYEGKMPNFTFYGGRKQATAMNMVLRYSAQKEFACIRRS